MFSFQKGLKYDKTCVINDPLGQTPSLPSSEHCFNSLEICFVLKSGDGRTDVRTDDMCKSNDHYRPWMWVGLVDQQLLVTYQSKIFPYLRIVDTHHKSNLWLLFSKSHGSRPFSFICDKLAFKTWGKTLMHFEIGFFYWISHFLLKSTFYVFNFFLGKAYENFDPSVWLFFLLFPTSVLFSSFSYAFTQKTESQIWNRWRNIFSFFCVPSSARFPYELFE